MTDDILLRAERAIEAARLAKKQAAEQREATRLAVERIVQTQTVRRLRATR
jgi:hypothetical protein